MMRARPTGQAAFFQARFIRLVRRIDFCFVVGGGSNTLIAARGTERRMHARFQGIADIMPLPYKLAIVLK